MDNRLFELKLEEVRAVIGGAVYYTSVNKLPVGPVPATLCQAPAPSFGLSVLPVR